MEIFLRGPRKSTRLDVVLERVNYERMELLGYDINSLMNYVYNGKFSQGVKDAVSKLQQLKAEESRLTAQLQEKSTKTTEIEAEQALVNSNRELIARFEKKIKTTLARVWGEEK